MPRAYLRHIQHECVDQRSVQRPKSSSDLVELWTAHTRKQIAVLNEQIKELTALGQKMAGESAEPITRSVSQAFKKAS
jgi:hypothetical protein